jgi:hypothetical protein
MSFNLTPAQYFAMVREEHQDFLADRASIRRAISCCTLMNHVLDHVVSHYFRTDPGKLRIRPGLEFKQAVNAYRDHVVADCPDVSVIRDLCDFGKHGSHLDRPTVQVKWTGLEETYGFHISFARVEASDYVKTVRVGIIMKDGQEMKLEAVLASVLAYWERRFAADAL